MWVVQLWWICFLWFKFSPRIRLLYWSYLWSGNHFLIHIPFFFLIFLFVLFQHVFFSVLVFLLVTLILSGLLHPLLLFLPVLLFLSVNFLYDSAFPVCPHILWLFYTVFCNESSKFLTENLLFFVELNFSTIIYIFSIIKFNWSRYIKFYNPINPFSCIIFILLLLV